MRRSAAKINVKLNPSASGQPYVTFGIGGFFTKDVPGMWFCRGRYPDGNLDPNYRELYVRWAQLGAFMPVTRPHGTDTQREPWSFGPDGEPYFDALPASIELRRTLLPFLYSLADRVTREGASMLRMLAFDFSG